MKLLRVAADQWNFIDEDGNYFTPFGANVLNDVHPASGTLFENFDSNDVERRFAAMQEYGLNMLRQPMGVNQLYDTKIGLKSPGIKNFHRFLQLAEFYGIRLMPVGGYLGSNDWFDVEQLADDGAALDDACTCWRAIVAEFAAHPAIFAWDLHNELHYDLVNHMTVESKAAVSVAENLSAGWAEFLRVKYGDLASMNERYGKWGSFSNFSAIPSFVNFVDEPGNLISVDFRHYLNEKGFRWSQRQVQAIREASPQHMVCSGNNGWLFPDMDLWLANGFHNLAHHQLYDFISVHPYPAPQCLPTGHGDPLNGGTAADFWWHAVEAMARIDHFQKPVVLQEFGWYGGGASRFLNELPYRSEAEHADYTRTLIEKLMPHANGFVNWPLCDMPASNDISNHGGLFTHDMQPKALAEVYRDLAGREASRKQQRKSATRVMTYSLQQLFTSRAYQDAMWEEIHTLTGAGEVLDYRFI